MNIVAQVDAPRFRPPTPPTSRTAPFGGAGPLAALRYFRTLARNPLETFPDALFDEQVAPQKFLGRRFLTINDPEGVRRVFSSNAENYCLNTVRQRILKPVLRDGLLTTEGEQWSQARRTITPVFTPRHVAGFSRAMIENSEALRDRLIARSGDIAPVSDLMTRLALDILADSLSADRSMLDRARFAELLSELLVVAGSPHPFDVIGMPTFLPRFGRLKAQRLVEELRDAFRSLAAKARAKRADGALSDGAAPGGADFLSLLLGADGDGGERFSDEEIVDHLLTFFAAGHETTARTLGWTLYLLAEAPEPRARVEAEIDAAPLSATPPERWGDVLPFTMAVVRESMRLYPPAPFLARQALGPDEVCGKEVREGDVMIVAPWLLHRHRKIWTNPDEFRPERFLGDTGGGAPKYAYIPFGLGPRVCIGASLSLQEIAIALGVLLRDLRFETCDAPAPLPIMRITLHPSTDLPLRATTRTPGQAPDLQ